MPGSSSDHTAQAAAFSQQMALLDRQKSQIEIRLKALQPSAASDHSPASPRPAAPSASQASGAPSDSMAALQSQRGELLSQIAKLDKTRADMAAPDPYVEHFALYLLAGILAIVALFAVVSFFVYLFSTDPARVKIAGGAFKTASGCLFSTAAGIAAYLHFTGNS